MVNSKKQNNELQCELFNKVNANCDRILDSERKNNNSWLRIKGIWIVILQIAVFAICIANLALLILLNKIYLF